MRMPLAVKEIPLSSAMLPISIRWVGVLSRRLSAGTRLCPPAMRRAPSPRLVRSCTASAMECARTYSNAAGFMQTPVADVQRPPHPSPLPASSLWRTCHTKLPYPQVDMVGKGDPVARSARSSCAFSSWGEGQDEGVFGPHHPELVSCPSPGSHAVLL